MQPELINETLAKLQTKKQLLVSFDNRFVLVDTNTF